MKTLLKLTLLCSLLFATEHTQAQFLKKLKKKAADAVERTVTRRTEREVEKSTDRALDSIVDGPKKKKKKKKDSGFNPMSMLGGNVTYDDAYNFPLNVTMDIQDGAKKGKTQTMIQYYGKEAFGMIEPKSGQLTVMDFKNEAALMLNPKDNTGQAVSLKFLEKMMKDVDLDDDEGDASDVSFTKTGNSKVIAGYKSYEYKMTSEDGKMIFWFAPQVPFNYKDYMEGFSKLFGKKFQGKWSNTFWDTYGFMMEAETYNKKGKLENKMTVTKVDTTNYAVDTNSYQIQKL